MEKIKLQLLQNQHLLRNRKALFDCLQPMHYSLVMHWRPSQPWPGRRSCYLKLAGQLARLLPGSYLDYLMHLLQLQPVPQNGTNMNFTSF